MKVTRILLADDLRKLSQEIRHRHRHHEGDEPPYGMSILADPPSEEDRRWMAELLIRPIVRNRNYPEPEPSFEERLENCIESWRVMTGGGLDEASKDLLHDYTVMDLQLRLSAKFAQRLWRLDRLNPDTDLADDAEHVADTEIPY